MCVFGHLYGKKCCSFFFLAPCFFFLFMIVFILFTFCFFNQLSFSFHVKSLSYHNNIHSTVLRMSWFLLFRRIIIQNNCTDRQEVFDRAGNTNSIIPVLRHFFIFCICDFQTVEIIFCDCIIGVRFCFGLIRASLLLLHISFLLKC